MKTITAYKCKNCGLVMYPHHYRCLNCNGREFKEMSPSSGGKLVTYTVIDQLPWGIDERGRVLGVVQFDNGVKALGLIQSENPRIGMKLKADWGPVRVIGGEKIMGLIFHPTR
ncbi:MAG: hypothetical protein GTO14_22350 [Anaerolineales bacterium]|nr:hypothetical protein [Anaerolineales bacterium]